MVSYIGEYQCYVDENGYVEYALVLERGQTKRVYPYKKAKTGGWNNYGGYVKLNTLRSGLRRGTYSFH